MSKLIRWLNKHNNYLPKGIVDKIIYGYNINNHSKIIPGWLSYLEKYRNLISHDRPIHMINFRIYAQLYTLNIDGNTIPQLIFPLPELPLIEENSYNFKYLEEKIIGINEKNDLLGTHDGLEICCRIYWELLNFLEYILEFSPIKPQILSINPSNATNFKINFREI